MNNETISYILKFNKIYRYIVKQKQITLKRNLSNHCLYYGKMYMII